MAHVAAISAGLAQERRASVATDRSAGFDEVLLSSYRNGDLAAFEQLVNRYHSRIYGFALRMTGDTELAEDMAQETFLRVMENAHRFREGGNLRVWLFSIAANLIRDALRKQRRRQRLWERQAQGETREDSTSHPSDLLTLSVRQALADLKPDHRAAVLLRHGYGLTYDEAAEALACSAGTVKSRVHYALRELRVALSEEEQ